MNQEYNRVLGLTIFIIRKKKLVIKLHKGWLQATRTQPPISTQKQLNLVLCLHPCSWSLFNKAGNFLSIFSLLFPLKQMGYDLYLKEHLLMMFDLLTAVALLDMALICMHFPPFHMKVSSWCVCGDLWVSQHQPGLPGLLRLKWLYSVQISTLRADQCSVWGKTAVRAADACRCVSVGLSVV